MEMSHRALKAQIAGETRAREEAETRARAAERRADLAERAQRDLSRQFERANGERDQALAKLASLAGRTP